MMAEKSETAEQKEASHAWYVYELAWILPSVALPTGMLAALLVTSFGSGIHLPTDNGRVEISKLSSTAPFDKPGLVELSPMHYEARYVGQIWSFSPAEIHVPVGATVTFVGTSRDVIHGFYIHGVNVNMMLIPGQVSRLTTHFSKPGEYQVLCHEYCGIAHHTMYARVIVDP